MLPGYKIFNHIESWGNYSFFLSLTESVYNDILQDNSNTHYSLLSKELLDNTPHLDDFDTYAASYAFDMCVAFEHLILFMLDGKKDHILNNSQTVMDTVDMFIQQKENIKITRYEDLPALEMMIAKDEFMKKEIARQINLLQVIDDTPQIDKELMDSIRKQNLNTNDIINYAYLY